MSKVQKYDPFGYYGLSALMTECKFGDYVRHEDYAALEAECASLRNRAKVAEREAHQALKTLKGLEKVAKVVSDNSDQVCGELNLMTQQRDAALAECERLREALQKIAAIKNRYNCGDWDEIEEARNIADAALSAKP